MKIHYRKAGGLYHQSVIKTSKNYFPKTFFAALFVVAAFSFFTKVNAQCTIGNTNSTSTFAVLPLQLVGQSITTTCTGAVKKAKFRLPTAAVGSTLNAFLKVYLGSGVGGPAVNTTPFPFSATVDANHDAVIVVPTSFGFSVSAGTVFTFVVFTQSAPWVLGYNINNPYPDGAAFAGSTPGATPVELVGKDFGFTLEVCLPSTSNDTLTACDSLIWNGVKYSTSGNYSTIFAGGNAQGCDSTAFLNLTVNYASTKDSTVAACDSFAWNGNKYFTSGNYSRFFPGGGFTGCDSTDNLHLTIKHSTGSDTTASACNSFTWNGVTYYNTGDKKYILTNAVGCDSIRTLHLTITSLSTFTTKQDITCFGLANGMITLTATSGTAPFSYRLGTVGPITSNNNFFQNLKVGTYRVYVKDVTGCIGVAVVTINQPPKVSALLTPTPVTGCYGGTNGQITVSNPTGIAPYMYKVGTFGTYAALNAPATVPNLKPGTYTVYVKDNNGCEANTGAVQILQPAPVTVTYTKVNPTCSAMGSLTITNPGSTYRINPGRIQYTSQSTYGGLAAGTYYCYAKDANGCAGRVGPIVLPLPSNCLQAKAVKPTTENGKQSLEVSLSPNPSSNQFIMVAHSSNLQPVSIRVIDANGRNVYSTKGLAEQTFSFGDKFANGLYMIEVRQGNEVKTMKVVKSR